MPKIKNVAEKVQIEIERFDMGLNTKASPSRIDASESPDCLNVVYDDQGAVSTREGTTYYNSGTTITTVASDILTNPIDGLTTYDGTMVVWAGGQMYRMSGTAAVPVTAASGQFSSGVAVAYEQYQNLLFCSDGTNGPWKYDGGQDFYNMGIDVPSAASADSNTSGGDIAADTYYYAVSFVNSQAVEGEVGSSVAVTLSASGAVDVSAIPVGSALAGVDARNIYRATADAGPYLYVGQVADNSTTTFEDNVAVGSEGGEAIADATSPTPFSAIKLHRDRLFFPDSSNETLLRYTEFSNPFVSQALSFLSLNRGDGSDIRAVGVQDDLIAAFKQGSIWIVALNDPSDDTTWQVVKSPANMGVVGARALIEIDNGIVFCGERAGRITGFHFLSGIDVMETNNRLLRTRSISERIEDNVFSWPRNLWSGMAMARYNNRIYIAGTLNASSSENDAIWWFDIDRLGSEGQPGSWSVWTGDVGVTDFTVYDGELYGGSSQDDGRIIQFNDGTYTDASGAAIDSYFYTKEFGGEASIESWIKDWRWLNLWYAPLGDWIMNVFHRDDGDTGSGDKIEVDLNPGTAVYGTAVYGTAVYSAGRDNVETQHPLGGKVGRRLQFRFDNQNTAGQAFRVNSLKALMGLRRQR